MPVPRLSCGPSRSESVGPQECGSTFIRISMKRSFGEWDLVSKKHRLIERDREDERQQVLSGKHRIAQRQALLRSRFAEGNCQFFGRSAGSELMKRLPELRESPCLADHQAPQLEDIPLHHALQEVTRKGPKPVFDRPVACRKESRRYPGISGTDDFRDDLSEQRLFVTEVLVHRLLGDPRNGCDLVHARPDVAVGEEHLLGCREDRSALLLCTGATVRTIGGRKRHRTDGTRQFRSHLVLY